MGVSVETILEGGGSSLLLFWGIKLRFHLLPFSGACSPLPFLSSVPPRWCFPSVSFLRTSLSLLPDVFLLASLCLPLQLIDPSSLLSNIKIAIWFCSIFKWMNTMNTDETHAGLSQFSLKMLAAPPLNGLTESVASSLAPASQRCHDLPLDCLVSFLSNSSKMAVRFPSESVLKLF